MASRAVIPSLFEKFGERMTVDTLLVDELAKRAILGEREIKRLEALLRAKDETLGELLELLSIKPECWCHLQ
jgi:uncharacterized small protein (DUF1192 family)